MIELIDTTPAILVNDIAMCVANPPSEVSGLEDWLLAVTERVRSGGTVWLMLDQTKGNLTLTWSRSVNITVVKTEAAVSEDQEVVSEPFPIAIPQLPDFSIHIEFTMNPGGWISWGYRRERGAIDTKQLADDKVNRQNAERTPYTKADSLVVHIDPGSASAKDIEELYVALSCLHRAYGGSGLVIEDVELNSFDMSEVTQ